MIRATRFSGTFMKMRTEPVDYDLPMHVAQERLMKAIRNGREGYVTEDLARLNSARIAADKIEGLFTPDEIRGAVARRRQKLLQKLRGLDKLVPGTEKEILISGERPVVDDADERGEWADLADYDARQIGGDGTTRRRWNRRSRPPPHPSRGMVSLMSLVARRTVLRQHEQRVGWHAAGRIRLRRRRWHTTGQL